MRRRSTTHDLLALWPMRPRSGSTDLDGCIALESPIDVQKQGRRLIDISNGWPALLRTTISLNPGIVGRSRASDPCSPTEALRMQFTSSLTGLS
jgi:hypothetical protein